MSVRVMAAVFSARVGARDGVSATIRKATLLKLADFANDTGGRVYPSVKTIADQCEIAERSVQRAIQSLLDEGILLLVRKGGGRTTSEYRINVEKLNSLPPTAIETGDGESPVGVTNQGCRVVTGVSDDRKQALRGDGQSPNPPIRIHQARSRTRAEDSKSILKSEVKGASVVVRRTDWGFRYWVDHLRRYGYVALLDEIERADALLAATPCPTGRDAPLPTVYHPEGGNVRDR